MTGASKGIGRACAEVLAAEGVDVVLVAHTAAFSFSLVALVGVPRSHSQASLIAAPTLSTTPTQHEAVIGTVIGRQCGELRRLSLRPGVEFVLFAQRAVFGSDYENGRRVHSSKPSSAWAAQIARHGFKVPRARPEWVREPDRVTMKIAGILWALVEVTSTAGAQTRGLPTPTPSPTIYSRPTPAPLAPPVNPGPAVVPPAGLSPLLTEPGPVSPPPQRAAPVYPSLQLPGPVGQQNMRAYRNSLLGQQWQRERRGISPGSERSREIQQQLNQTSPQ